MDEMKKILICDIAKDINCDIDDILRIAANDNQLKRPPFFLWAYLPGGWAHYLDVEGEPMPNRMQMTVGNNYSLLQPHEIGLLRLKGAITLTKFIPSIDEIHLDDWSWWRFEPPQEITPKNVAIEVADMEVLLSLLAKATQAAPMVETVPVAASAQVTEHKLRRNSLDPAIDEAIERAGSSIVADVFLALREIALAGRLPFTGEVEGDALCYTDDENKVVNFTKDALRKRLSRR